MAASCCRCPAAFQPSGTDSVHGVGRNISPSPEGSSIPAQIVVVEPLGPETKLTRDRGVQTVLTMVHEPINGQPDEHLLAVAGHHVRLLDPTDDA